MPLPSLAAPGGSGAKAEPPPATEPTEPAAGEPAEDDMVTRAMAAFRWLRDHYRPIQVAGGAIMVALGLLLFFERFYVLRVYLNRFLEWLGLEPAF